MVIFDLEYMQPITETDIKGGDSWFDFWIKQLEEIEKLFPTLPPSGPFSGTIVHSSTTANGGASTTHTYTYDQINGWRHHSHHTP